MNNEHAGPGRAPLLAKILKGGSPAHLPTTPSRYNNCLPM
eukprot:CAMPEP_0183771746 /NCGR_PEP_ID=MMETSP0739-20130205/33639_1 /TAXON_ID=385413 /ORGANISM="Thalassiosira miniscula, Strain CCMP1093" /LENGTH=39 /DNA_ID= /DNA_START= /DNA_END= /DNA_ORIENTATION=